jgi:hypothetical protein
VGARPYLQKLNKKIHPLFIGWIDFENKIELKFD